MNSESLTSKSLASALPPASRPAPSSSTVVDLFGPVHKGLRFALAPLVSKLGAEGFRDPARTKTLLDELETVLWMVDNHVAHEDKCLRPALLERTPLTVAHFDADHETHRRQVAELRALSRALLETPLLERARAAQSLYLHYTTFVADTFAHMADEERVIQSLLDRNFTPEELGAIHTSILSSLTPREVIVFAMIMVGAATPEDRVQLLAPMRAAPPALLAEIIRAVRSALTQEEWNELASRVGL